MAARRDQDEAMNDYHMHTKLSDGEGGFDGFVAEGPRPSIKDSAIRVVEYVNIV